VGKFLNEVIENEAVPWAVRVTAAIELLRQVRGAPGQKVEVESMNVVITAEEYVRIQRRVEEEMRELRGTFETERIGNSGDG